MKSIADMGVTVAATIHSPTSFSFSLCDQLLLLTRGRVLYFGPNGEPCQFHHFLGGWGCEGLYIQILNPPW